jgi:hypothetical protein
VIFDHKLQRTISVDIRYVLFIIDKFAGATNIIDAQVRFGDDAHDDVQKETSCVH